MSYLMKIHPVGDELFHADGQTDMTKVIVAFRNFANASRRESRGIFCDVVNGSDRNRVVIMQAFVTNKQVLLNCLLIEHIYYEA
jgi:hypothetical protein